MKWIIFLAITFVSLQAAADFTVGNPDDFDAQFNENQYGKTDAVDREYFYDQMTLDIKAIEVMRTIFKRNEDSDWVEATSQYIGFAKKLRESSAGLESDFIYEQAEKAFEKIELMRVNTQDALKKYEP